MRNFYLTSSCERHIIIKHHWKSLTARVSFLRRAPLAAVHIMWSYNRLIGLLLTTFLLFITPICKLNQFIYKMLVNMQYFYRWPAFLSGWWVRYSSGRRFLPVGRSSGNLLFWNMGHYYWLWVEQRWCTSCLPPAGTFQTRCWCHAH